MHTGHIRYLSVGFFTFSISHHLAFCICQLSKSQSPCQLATPTTNLPPNHRAGRPSPIALVWQYKAFTVYIMQYCNDR